MAQGRSNTIICSRLGNWCVSHRKWRWVGAVVAHQAEQGGSIALPVILAEVVGRLLVEAEVALDIFPHRLIDVRKDVGVALCRCCRDRTTRRDSSSGRSVPLKSPLLRAFRVCRRCLVRLDHGADAVVGQDLEQGACSTRPSMMCMPLTPLRAASSAEPIFGSMPPDSVPSATMSSICLGVIPVINWRLVQHARRVGEQDQLLGLQHFGDLAGDDIGVDVVGFALFADANGAMTGMKAPLSRWSISDGSIWVISPTWPTSIRSPGLSLFSSISFLARMQLPSLPVRPTALPPCWLIRLTMSLLTWPPSTISTTSMVSASVTRALDEFALLADPG